MRKQPKPIGKLGLSPRFEPHLGSLDAKENEKIRARRIEKIKDSWDSVSYHVGRTVLAGLYSARIIKEPTENSNRLRDIGRRVTVATAISAVLLTGAVVAERLDPTPGDCATVSLDDLGTADPIEGARAVSKSFVGEGARPDAVEMAHQFDEQGYISECNNQRVEDIYRDLADN